MVLSRVRSQLHLTTEIVSTIVHAPCLIPDSSCHLQAADFLADEKGFSTVIQALVKRLSLHDAQSPTHPRALYRMRSTEANRRSLSPTLSTSFPSHTDASVEFEDRRELEAASVRLLHVCFAAQISRKPQQLLLLLLIAAQKNIPTGTYNEYTAGLNVSFQTSGALQSFWQCIRCSFIVQLYNGSCAQET